MFKYFTGSFIVTILGIISAFIWGEHVHKGSGFTCVFIASVLAILEIRLPELWFGVFKIYSN